MTIRAKLHDGRTLEFPDGTDPSVVQATVKRVLGKKPSSEPAGPTPEKQRLDRSLRVQNEEQERKAKSESVFGAAIGAGEFATSMIIGAGGEIASGVTGIVEGVDAMFDADRPVLDATADRIRDMQSRLSFTPKTEVGKKLSEIANVFFGKAQEFATTAGDATLSATGSPALAAGAQVIAENLPGAGVGRFVGTAGRGARIAEARQFESEVARTGVDLGAKTPEQLRQFESAALAEAGGMTSKAFSMEAVQESVRDVSNVLRGYRDRLYARARAKVSGESPAAVSRESVMRFGDAIRRGLTRDRGFDLEEMPILSKRLDELTVLDERFPDGSKIKLEAMERWRQRIKRNAPPTTDAAQNAGLQIMQRAYDEWIQAQFNADMISGDPAAIRKWKDARNAHQHWRETVAPQKGKDAPKDASLRVIGQIREAQMTPEEIRRWVVGASLTGAKKEASAVVSRLKGMLGADSPQFVALRQDLLLDIVEPLLGDTPNFGQFIKNYDRLRANNSSLFTELLEDSESNLATLRKMAPVLEQKGIAEAAKAGKFDLSKVLSMATFGHAISRAALRVGLARDAMKMIAGARTRSRRRLMMAEMLGYDARSPALGSTAAGQALGVAGISQAESSAEETP